MQNQFVDAVALSGMRLTSDGYLVGEVKCARTGVQAYRGAEMGLVDRDTVRVYRPENAVFATDSLATFAGKPITIGHPSEMVSAENWKDLAVGDIGEEIARDGQFVRVSIKLMDASAIRAVQDGTREVSMGYTTPIKMEQGFTPEGEAYDAIQTGPIKINHLAIVPKGRAGSECRIGDGADVWGAAPITVGKKEDYMSDALKSVVLGDEAIQVSAADAAKFEAEKAKINQKLSDAEGAHQAALDAKDAEIAQRDAEIAKLKDAQISDADLDAKVQARAGLIGKAAAIAKDVATDGLSDADIRKAVVAAKLGDEAIADRSDAYIEARFDVLAEDAAKGDPVVDALKQDKAGKPVTLDGVYEERNAALADAWKQPMKQEA